MSDAGGIARALCVPPTTVPLILERPAVVPAEAGFYAWWAEAGAIAGVPHVPHPTDDVGLLYVGISPSRVTSRQTVRGRVLGNHLRGNIGSSTVRFVLAALLIDELKLQPEQRSARIALRPDDSVRLRDWQKEHLRLTWCVRAQPWEVEHEVITRLAPPLNSAGNATHPFYGHVREARAELRRRAVES